MIVLPHRRKAFRGGATNPILDGIGFWYDMAATGNQTDQSGNGNTATATGSPAVSTGGGPGGQDAVVFDGTDDYYSITHASPFTVFGGGVSWSWSGWHWIPTGGLSGYPTIMSKRSGTEEWQVSGGDTATKFDFYSSQGYLDSGLTIARETWYHFVVTYLASTKAVTIYRDGNSTPVASTTFGTHASANTNSIYIGAYQAGGFPFKGRMFSIAKWNRVITTTEIAELYNSGSGLLFSDL
jgi:hypothetical protein